MPVRDANVKPKQVARTKANVWFAVRTPSVRANEFACRGHARTGAEIIRTVKMTLQAVFARQVDVFNALLTMIALVVQPAALVQPAVSQRCA